ncbi:response regulator transcription factor [Rothia sp. HC945]|uniref:winged helix family transcriptional regulator n=1 Tax=Rothia sp. HC945 TaxID=3171170 RepID=UPI002652DA36|nr:response regulator transcription factor [Kocuria sp.]MDN5616906.1 response regulator transcription factor [Kocuria sp.]MDN5654725.1 response regulator transcription factor [Kocuria sp.]
MVKILMLSDAASSPDDVVPALALLPHEAEVRPLAASPAEIASRSPELLLVDGTGALVNARNTVQMLGGNDLETPMVMVLTEGGLAAVSPHWLVDDILLESAGPAEVEARIRLAAAGSQAPAAQEDVIRCGDVIVDEATYSARAGQHTLNLTYKEFELLKFMAQNPRRVFTRAQLLSEVWGYDYYGGTRTVDVHIRRLRAKLGPDHDQLITTVRNVGYSFTETRSTPEE